MEEKKMPEDVQKRIIELSLQTNFSDCESDTDSGSDSTNMNMNQSITNAKDQTYDDINMNNDDEWENINLDEYDISGLCFDLLRGEENGNQSKVGAPLACGTHKQVSNDQPATIFQ